MKEFTQQNLPNDEKGFVRELAARLLLLAIAKDAELGHDLQITSSTIKGSISVAEDLWAALYKYTA